MVVGAGLTSKMVTLVEVVRCKMARAARGPHIPSPSTKTSLTGLTASFAFMTTAILSKGTMSVFRVTAGGKRAMRDTLTGYASLPVN